MPRRVAALLYDALLLFSVLFVATTPWLLFSHGQAIEPNDPRYGAYLLAVSYAYFGWFWTHGGQTLGMRAWRISLRTSQGHSLTWARALARFAAALLSWALLGAGFIWIVFDPEHRSLHGRLSATTLVLDQPRDE